MKNLKSLIKINSYENKDEIVDYINNYFKDKAEEIRIIKNEKNNNKSIIIGINTKLKDIMPIILSGHIDTVNPDFDKYNTNPLDLVEIDGKCYGLGSIDMKSFIAVIMDNLDKLKKINCPVIVTLTTDEETDLLCIKDVIQELQKLNIKPAFTIVGEPTNSQFNITAKGCFEYVIEVFGKSCHSSRVAEGINAIHILSKIITFIENKQQEYEDLTSNCGIISGGTIINRVPDYAKLNFDVRTLNSSVEDFITSIQQKIEDLVTEYSGCNITLKQTLDIMPLKRQNEKYITYLGNQIGADIGDFSGGCEAGYYQNYSGDAIIFGVGDISLAHKPNEYVVIKEYQQYSEKLLKLIKIISKDFNQDLK